MHFEKARGSKRLVPEGVTDKSTAFPRGKDFKFEEKKEKMANCWSFVVWNSSKYKVQWVGGKGKRCGGECYQDILCRVWKLPEDDDFFKGTVLLRRCGVDEKQPWLKEELLWWKKLP